MARGAGTRKDDGMDAQRKPWAAPRLVPLTSSAGAKSGPPGGNTPDGSWTSGFENGFS